MKKLDPNSHDGSAPFALELSRNGDWVARLDAAQQTVHVANLALSKDHGLTIPLPTPASLLALAGDGSKVAVATADRIHFFAVPSGKEFLFAIPSPMLSLLALDSAGHLIASPPNRRR